MAFVDGVAITLHREEIEFEREEMLKELTNKKRDEAVSPYRLGETAGNRNSLPISVYNSGS